MARIEARRQSEEGASRSDRGKKAIVVVAVAKEKYKVRIPEPKKRITRKSFGCAVVSVVFVYVESHVPNTGTSRASLFFCASSSLLS